MLRNLISLAICLLMIICKPNAGCDHLRDVFVKQMGLSDKDIVALSGAHTLVCCTLLLFNPICCEVLFLHTYFLVIFFFREDATRSVLVLRDLGPPIPLSLTTHTLRKNLKQTCPFVEYLFKRSSQFLEGYYQFVLFSRHLWLSGSF